MSREELLERLRQQLSSRLDFVRYKARVDFRPRRTAAVSSRPRFFFSPESVPGLCSRLRQLFPDVSDQIIERAERICEHRFDLLGYSGLDYGTEIDWHCDRIHGKRAPRKPWFAIHYLDFTEVGDAKITWELNRHQHLVTLAKAFRLSGDRKFANELFRQWQHWQVENPYPIGINWASSLEVAFRSLSWLWVYFLLADSAAVPAGFVPELLGSLAVSGRHIERYLSAYFSPNTHLLGEGVALFFIGTLCPEIPSAPRWQRAGWKIVQQEAERQVRVDGLHFEQSTYYHVYALDFFLHAAILASANQIPLPSQLERTLERMLEALSVLARAGSIPQFGDDDGGRVFDPSRNRTIHLFDPLATGAVLFGRGDFKALAGGPREETLWLLGEQGIDEFDRIEAVSRAPASTAFQISGLYVLADDCAERQLVIDAGPQGALSAGHGHADALSIMASVGGVPLLIDSGTFEYVGGGSERNRFRGTGAHNTLMIDGQGQAQPKGPFSWGTLPNVRAEGWIVGKTFDLFKGSHDGYLRLPDPVVHSRLVFSLKSHFWLVRDEVLGRGEHQIDLFWHLNPALKAVNEQGGVFRGDGQGLAVITAQDHEWRCGLEEEPYSPVYGRKEAHSVLHFETNTGLPAEFVTLLQPLIAGKFSGGKLSRVGTPSAPGQVGYRFKTPHDEHCVVFGTGTPWKLDTWSSDAQFLYFGSAGDGSWRTLIACHATYVEYRGQKIVGSERAILRCEIIENKGQVEIVSSAPSAEVKHEELRKALTETNVVPAGNQSQ